MPITLRQTAEHNHLAHFPAVFSLYSFQYGLYGFLLGISYETACIEQKYINGNILSLRNNLIMIFHLGKDMFGVNLVLGTAQGNGLKFLLHQDYSASSVSASSSGFTKSREA